MLRLLHSAIPILILTPATGLGAGGVISVAVTTLPVVAGESETIVVTVSAPCSAVKIDFGDGVTQNYPATPPMTTIPPYAWMTTGTKTVKATGINDCTGEASTTINVQTGGVGSGLGNLCQVVDCGTFANLVKPKITGILAASKPDGAGYIKGKNFGTAQGSIVVNLSRFDGSPQPRSLQIVSWSPTFIEVKYPSDISGVMDQDTTVQAITASEAKSNGWPILFSAAAATAVFPYEEMLDIDCGTDSNSDICGQEIDEGDFDGLFDFNPFRGPCSGTLCGFHENVTLAIGDDSDTDVFRLPDLKKGWEYSGFEKLTWNTSGGKLYDPTGLVPNSSKGPVVSVKWMVTPADDVEYDIAVRIRGPVGVPHK